MTEVAFHFNAPDKVSYACRLLRKAAQSGAKVVVTAEPALLRNLDVALWSFSALDFVSHCYATKDAVMQRASAVVLADSLQDIAQDTPPRQVLLNLGEDVPAGFERFERLIEVVTLQDADRAGARNRWRHYADRGYSIKRHDLALKEQS
ncbi:MAG TPA: DNA polymerase III subunit chi [Burkholderiaceae bacterium]|nr:DNA polymerase III subunit chi [Burkholderiaceae bacterium]